MLLAATVLPLEGSGAPAPEHVRGWFYRLIRELSPSLHDIQQLKPFTLSVLESDPPAIRITFMDERLHAASSPKLWGLVGQELQLGSASYRVCAVLEQDHPWARLSSYPRLFHGGPEQDYPMRFVTPTLFKRHGAHYPLPEPRLVFGSLLARFKAFAPVTTPASLPESIERLTLRYAHIRTHSIEHATRAVGFTGRTVYHLPNASEDEARWLTALWRFAFFAGVGAKTTLGFGQVKPYLSRPKPRVAKEDANGSGGEQDS